MFMNCRNLQLNVNNNKDKPGKKSVKKGLNIKKLITVITKLA